VRLENLPETWRGGQRRWSATAPGHPQRRVSAADCKEGDGENPDAVFPRGDLYDGDSD